MKGHQRVNSLLRRSGLDDLPWKSSPPVGSKVLDVRHLSSVVWQVAMLFFGFRRMRWSVERQKWLEVEKQNSSTSEPWWNSLRFILCVCFFCFLFLVNIHIFKKKEVIYTLYWFWPPAERIFNKNPTNGSPLRCGATWHRVRPLFRASATWDGALPCALRRHPWRYQPVPAVETWNGREGRNPSPPKPKPLKTWQQKGRTSETPLNAKKTGPGTTGNKKE